MQSAPSLSAPAKFAKRLCGLSLRVFLHLFAAVLLFTLASTSNAAPLSKREWKLDGVTREALIHVPNTKTNASPVVFAFHGHGGSMSNAAHMFAFHTIWPEAIVVYMQGLNTPGRFVDPEGKYPGWQHVIGEADDRDLKFFDTVLATLKREYRVDGKRIYASGHSNGGHFTYLLWATRGGTFAAVAPSGSPVAENFSKLKPKPVLHVAGEKDALVKFEWQKRTIDQVRNLNQCREARPWHDEEFCTLYSSSIGAPLVTYIHPGGHQFPKEAPAIIVRFFKEHSRQ